MPNRRMKNATPMLTHRFQDSLGFALTLHAKQVRKNTSIPYFSHLMGVSSLALEHGANEDEAIGGLLHDAGEDAGGRAIIEVISSRFGGAVADIVEGCTDTFESPKPPWRQRKEAYVLHLRTASPSVRLVSEADKVHNARAILTDLRTHGNAVWDRFSAGKEGTLWYYRALGEAFSAHGQSALARELCITVEEIEKVARLPWSEVLAQRASTADSNSRRDRG
jgi:(p)ppGpp synthase/HD superfamily hydrolase